MKSIRVIIADDCSISRRLLNKLLKSEPDIYSIVEVENGSEMISRVLVEEPDLALVDVTMPMVNGIDAVKECITFMPHMKVIFITGHNNYALEAFDVSAVDYIVKPINRERLFCALEKAKQAIYYHRQLERAKIENPKPLHDGRKKLVCRYEGTTFYIAFQNIIFIEKEGRKALIHTPQKVIETNETMSSLLERLDVRFIQSHRSYILNIEQVSEINNIGDSYLARFDNYPERAYISKSNFQRVAHYIERLVSIDTNRSSES
ncbi:LytR/AlgR family response regulator transcription factor [Alkalihalobacterium chitinilyticum]|uniref:LytTR family DNA-binding domain-containing protein n=1 Tax=Alkalihalobacterium chitinilyticum TaxID=2980103 RepID=A0ABT5VGK2_9BACI|nr:LytTR family DNA-binding domain-containing protein [Alkalihalobacterium chitinilyticum]MDE5414590.1 LytTR family DNA-binding domain-containing protein [Alkalihalobacterium chitinilyticum]